MSFDGIFIHNLLIELSPFLLNQRINQINGLDQSSFVFSLSNKKQLIIVVQPDTAHMRLSELDFVFDFKTSSLLNMLKKYAEKATITNITQKDNDRIVIFDLVNINYLNEKKQYHLILEFFGRNANMILVDDDYVVIECEKKIFSLSENENRIMLPKMPYTFPKNDKINPFFEKELASQNVYTGISPLLYQEMIKENSLNLIYQKVLPTMIQTEQKNYFYCFDLPRTNGNRTHFPTLSLLLEFFYHHLKKQNTMNVEQKMVESFIKKEINKLTNKLEKQKQEMNQAQANLSNEQLGNLLSTNLYLVKKGDTKIEVANYYEDNQLVEIPLNPLLDPTKNLNAIFAKYKKAKRALVHLSEQIAQTELDLQYYLCLESQMHNSMKQEIQEIMQELGIGKAAKTSKKLSKPQLTTFEDQEGNKIIVGKNNLQNNYLTHTLANKNDYFFHVKNAPGSHTILQAENPSLSTLILAAEIAAYYSNQKLSSQVAVDYTFVKNVKKVPKTKGSFVTYTKQKTLFVTPDWEKIKQKINKRS